MKADFPREFGKYVLLRPLARGGMGEIFLAAGGELGGFEKLCVIKKVLGDKGDRSRTARFMDEAKVVVRLQHANLVTVFDAGEVDGELYIAMEFVEGKNLREVWNRCAQNKVRFPRDVALYLIREIARGLGYVHEYGQLGLVHRDVSPPNILLSCFGEVKLTDFGLARSSLKMEKTAPGVVFGRYAYLAPEQARGEAADARSDLYALGIVLWELLSGSQLFNVSELDPLSAIAIVRAPRIARPSTRSTQVTPELDDVVMRALAPRREGRYASADEMRRAIAEVLARTAPTTDGERVQSFLRSLYDKDIESERNEREHLLREALPRWRKESRGDDPQEVTRVERATPGVSQALPPRTSVSFSQQAAAARAARAAGSPKQAFARATVAASTPALALAQGFPSEEALLGMVLESRYRLERVIGRGGMGTVYEAVHVGISKRMAVKVLKPEFARDAALVARFRREARAASAIGHPHIIDISDIGNTPDGSVFIAMEYLEGTDLAMQLHHERSLPLRRAIHIVVQVCRALEAAHAVGVIHRDLKPENIFLCRREGGDDFVKVVDFGIAQATGEESRRLTSPGFALGTPEYMAPEQAAGGTSDARSDVYSLGAILYEMILGRAPHEGQNPFEVLQRKASEPVRPPREILADFDPKLERVIMKCLELDPNDRPASMAVLESELRLAWTTRIAEPAVELTLSAAAVAARESAEMKPPSAPLQEAEPDFRIRPRGRTPNAVVRYGIAGGCVVAIGVGAWFAFRKSAPPQVITMTSVPSTKSAPEVRSMPSLPEVVQAKPVPNSQPARRPISPKALAGFVAAVDRAIRSGRYNEPSSDSAASIVERIYLEAEKVEPADFVYRGAVQKLAKIAAARERRGQTGKAIEARRALAAMARAAQSRHPEGAVYAARAAREEARAESLQKRGKAGRKASSRRSQR